jgi:hypothetical protein
VVYLLPTLLAASEAPTSTTSVSARSGHRGNLLIAFLGGGGGLDDFPWSWDGGGFVFGRVVPYKPDIELVGL